MCVFRAVHAVGELQQAFGCVASVLGELMETIVATFGLDVAENFKPIAHSSPQPGLHIPPSREKGAGAGISGGTHNRFEFEFCIPSPGTSSVVQDRLLAAGIGGLGLPECQLFVVLGGGLGPHFKTMAEHVYFFLHVESAGVVVAGLSCNLLMLVVGGFNLIVVHTC